MIKFISYTGKYPCLCMGILTLEIDGDIIRFGNRYNDSSINYPSFWTSGGECGFYDDWEEYVTHNAWEVHKEELPEKYQKYTDEISKLFNERVPYGCCGGCI